ncbi:MAG TPA: alkaline phosphatase family protein [Gemmatimonadaceae bacterium]
MIRPSLKSTVVALCAVGLLAACGKNTPLPTIKGTLSSLTGKHHFDHFVLIVLENEDAANVTAIPYMDSLAHRGAWLRNYYAVAHPSYPNYLALVSGRTFFGRSANVSHDPIAYSRRDLGDAQLLIDAPTIVNGLEATHMSWDAFAEDYPERSSAPRACDFRRSAGLYSRKHFPFLSFADFHRHPEWCAHVRNLEWFRRDSLAAYTFVAPNLVHDGHDAPMSTAAAWLRGFLEPILADTVAMKSTVIVVTFDEASNSVRQSITRSWRPNVVYTVLLGPPINPGTSSDVPFSHYSLLRTVETNFGLSPSLLPDGVSAIEGIWK